MSFETAADASIRPTVGPAATPAHAAANRAAAGAGAASAQQATWLNQGSNGERGAKAGHETAASDLSFYDLLDVINPLQHIPGVASAYRALTGDEISPPAEILGGALYGGPLGLVASVANAVIKESSGRDIGEAALAILFGEETSPGDVAAAGADGLGEAIAAAPSEDAPAVASGAAQAAILAAETQPAAGATTTASDTPTAGLLPPEATPELAETAAGNGGEGAAAVAQAMKPTEGAALSGKAALNAFLDDLATLGREASGAPPASAEAAAKQPQAPETAAQARTGSQEGNLIGLGNRDKRPGARTAASRTPVATIPAAQLTGATRPTGDSAPSPSGARLVGGAAPRLPGSPPVDPTLFIPKEEQAAAPADFSQQMMRALQKYETLLEDRPATGGDPS